jgi:hypothetical protein
MPDQIEGNTYQKQLPLLKPKLWGEELQGFDAA